MGSSTFKSPTEPASPRRIVAARPPSTCLARSPGRKMTEPQSSLQSAEGYGIAQAYGLNASATVNIGLTPKEVQELVRAASEAQQAKIDDLSLQFNVTREAVRGFLSILNTSDVPIEKLPQVLAEIAQRHVNMLQRLSPLDPEDPAAKAAIDEARTILRYADSAAAYNRADALLAHAEALD